MPKPKRPPAPPRLCIFCNRPGKMSKEHILAERLRPYLPKSPINRRRNVEFSNPQPGLYVAQNTFREGHGFHATVRRVCEKCNNEWMSGLETEAAYILTPL